MQQAQDLIDGLMLFRFGASRRNLTSMTLALMNWVLYCSHGLRLYDNLGRVRPVSQAYYESEKLFFGGALAIFCLTAPYGHLRFQNGRHPTRCALPFNLIRTLRGDVSP